MKPDQNESLERTLESAIVASWKDLTHDAPNGLIHLEYGVAAGGTLDYLKVWSSPTRGHWLLACDYWMSANTFHDAGVHFDNGYESKGLADTLEFVMQHQSYFILPKSRDRQGLLQISTPTLEDRTAAVTLIDRAFHLDASSRAEPAVA